MESGLTAQPARTVPTNSLTEVEQAQLRALLEHLPAITFAPLAGVIFTAWVLWDTSDRSVLVVLGFCVLAVSLIRLLAYGRTRKQIEDGIGPGWGRFMVITALLSGLTWGAFAVLLYPTIDPSSERFLIILMALVPIAPVAALATYIRCFYAYYIPASAPFVIVLLLENTRAGWTSAVLLLILMFATLQFARNFHKNLTETYLLQIKETETAEKLRESLAAKSQFMTDANHDLRQPLQALELSLFSEHAEKQGPEVSIHLASASLAVATMKEYLDRLQQHSDLERDTLPNVLRFPIQDVLDRLMVLFRPIADANGTQLICVASSLRVNSDKDSVEILTSNLVENAIRHAGPSRKVLIGCRRQADKVVFHVLDNGPGIAAEQQARIFDEFTQLANPTRDRSKGIGLGLPIAQRAAKRNGTLIRLNSVLGRGSGFSVSLTRAEAMTSYASNTSARESRHTQKALHILVIDGEEQIQSGFARLLEDWGHKAQSASNVAQAQALISRHCAPDLLITDYRLEPDRNGFDAFSAIKQTIGHDIPCIIITGNTDAAVEARAEQENCYFFIKPVELVALRTLLSTLSQRVV